MDIIAELRASLAEFANHDRKLYRQGNKYIARFLSETRLGLAAERTSILYRDYATGFMVYRWIGEEDLVHIFPTHA